MWGLTVGAGGGLGGGRQRGNNGDNCDKTTIKYSKREREKVDKWE